MAQRPNAMTLSFHEAVRARRARAPRQASVRGAAEPFQPSAYQFRVGVRPQDVGRQRRAARLRDRGRALLSFGTGATQVQITGSSATGSAIPLSRTVRG